MKRIENLKYYTLIARFNESVDSFISLLFANGLMHEYLIRDELKDDLLLKKYLVVPTYELLDQSLLLTGEKINELVLNLSKRRSYSKELAQMDLLKMNSHFLRTKYAIDLYEVTLNYFEGLGKEYKKIRDELFRQEWFKVLWLIRDNSAHFDNFGKLIAWHWPKEDKIEWESICIKKGDIAHEIRYNDYELIQIGKNLRTFFIDRINEFDKG